MFVNKELSFHDLHLAQDVEPIRRVEHDKYHCEGQDPAVVDDSEYPRRRRSRARRRRSLLLCCAPSIVLQ